MMPKSHPPYPVEYRNPRVEGVRSGRGPEALSREFEPCAETLRNGAAQADRDAALRRADPGRARGEPSSSTREPPLAPGEGRLDRAAAGFARERGTLPKADTPS